MEDWSGEVIAEVRRDYAEPFLGLRYPASDIPPEARKLYLENTLRVVVDVASSTCGLVALATETLPLDLSQSKLRSMSQYHIEYLKNMSVGATGTASLIVNGQLWGLVASHHAQRKPVSCVVCKSMERAASGLSESILRRQKLSLQRLKIRIASHIEDLEKRVLTPHEALVAPIFGVRGLVWLFQSCGIALWSETGVFRIGETPGFSWIAQYAKRQLTSGENVFRDTQLTEFAAGELTTSVANRIAGVLSLRLFSTPDIILCCFRPEEISEVLWGGDIREPVLRDENLGKLSPSRSFAVHKELSKGKSAAWSDDDLETADRLRRMIQTALGGSNSASDALTSLFVEMRKAVLKTSPV